MQYATSYIVIPWEPFTEAREAVRDAFEAQGRGHGIFGEEVPSTWQCAECGEAFTLDQIHLGIDDSMGIPVCPTRNCPGHGWLVIRPT